MAAVPIAISPQDELLRLTGTTGNPVEDVTATGGGTGRYYGANQTFNVRPQVAGTVTGTSPTLDVKIQISPDNVTWTDALSFTQITASNAAATLSLTAAPRYTYTTPSGFPWVRIFKTIGGSATPTFRSFSVLFEPAIGF